MIKLYKRYKVIYQKPIMGLNWNQIWKYACMLILNFCFPLHNYKVLPYQWINLIKFSLQGLNSTNFVIKGAYQFFIPICTWDKGSGETTVPTPRQKSQFQGKDLPLKSICALFSGQTTCHDCFPIDKVSNTFHPVPSTSFFPFTPYDISLYAYAYTEL